VAILDIATREVTVNDAFAALVGLEAGGHEVLHLDELVPLEYRSIVESVIAGLASGVLEVVQGRANMRLPGGGELEVIGWARSFDDTSPTTRLVLSVVPADGTPPFSAQRYLRADTERVVQLEGHLKRIVAELRAADLVDPPDARDTWRAHPAVRDLSHQQLQIVERLVAGERVPTIADALFVSQSTVRNHLSAVYRKLGVHSQSELLARIKSSPPSES
jgi:DNA-binding NarL/FixJ family response regulator